MNKGSGQQPIRNQFTEDFCRGHSGPITDEDGLLGRKAHGLQEVQKGNHSETFTNSESTLRQQ